MIRYVIKRLLLCIPVLICVTLLIFVLISFAPGDAVDAMGNQGLTAEQEAELRAYYGLDQNVFVQYFNYMKKFITTGSLGESISFKQEVATLYLQRFPATMALAGFAILIALVIALPLGIYSALHVDSIGDNICTVAALLGVSVPGFWIGLLMIMLFSLKLGWLPAGEFNGLKSIIMPAFTCGIVFISALMRQTRSSMLDCLGSDYLRTASSKGVPRKQVVMSHAFRNALIPIIATAGEQVAFLLGGSAVSEAVFNWPGVGRLLLKGINTMDTPLICGCVIMQTIMISVVMLIVDILFAFVDPRIKGKYAKGGKA